jgi:hypothetical protein
MQASYLGWSVYYLLPFSILHTFILFCAGVQFAAKATPSRMVYTTVSHAGLMDPAAILFSPAIKISYNTHTLEHLIIEDNMADGLEIMKNDVFSNTKLAHSVVRNNFGNGVASRTSFFEVYFCTLENNEKAGFEYNPHYTTYEAQQIRFSIHDPIVLDEEMIQHTLPDAGREFVITKQQFVSGQYTYTMEIKVNDQHRVNIDIIDYNPDTLTENVTVYESEADKITENTIRWTLEDDLVDFPVTSAGKVLTVKWKVHGMSSGRFAFVIRASESTLFIHRFEFHCFCSLHRVILLALAIWTLESHQHHHTGQQEWHHYPSLQSAFG